MQCSARVRESREPREPGSRTNLGLTDKCLWTHVHGQMSTDKCPRTNVHGQMSTDKCPWTNITWTFNFFYRHCLSITETVCPSQTMSIHHIHCPSTTDTFGPSQTLPAYHRHCPPIMDTVHPPRIFLAHHGQFAYHRHCPPIMGFHLLILQVVPQYLPPQWVPLGLS